MNKNKKPSTDTSCEGFTNQLNIAGGKGNQFLDYFATIPTKNQRLCPCGAQIPRDEVLLEKARLCTKCRRKETELKSEILAIVTTPRRIVKCTPCKKCKKPFALNKLSVLLICKSCLESVRVENPAKRNRIIAGIIENYAAALRRQINNGGCV